MHDVSVIVVWHVQSFGDGARMGAVSRKEVMHHNRVKRKSPVVLLRKGDRKVVAVH